MQSTTASRAPTLTDRLFQGFYWLAFRGALAWWFLRRPAQEGHLVVIWHGGRGLLIRNSYHGLWSAPGGSAKGDESPSEAAARETLEEVGIAIPPADLVLALDIEHPFRFRRDRVRIFAWTTATSPDVAIDHREVVATSWVTPEEALRLPLIPHLRSYFETMPAGGDASGLAAPV